MSITVDARSLRLYPDGGAALQTWIEQHGIDPQHCRSVTVTGNTATFEMYDQPLAYVPGSYPREIATHRREVPVRSPMPLPPTRDTHPQ
jgi:hypothetical protein